jgi:hypothetical protein
MNLNLWDDVFIAFSVAFLRVAFEKVFFEPIAIVWGRQASVELLAQGYEALDFIMGDLIRTYKGEELRNQIRNKLEQATGTKWSSPMVQEFISKFDITKAAERIANCSEQHV